MNTFKEEIFILTHSLRVFSLWLASPIAFGLTARQKHHGGRAYWRTAAHFVVSRKQRGKEIGKCQGQGTSFSGHIPVTYILQ
jgi:hypothetical protein